VNKLNFNLLVTGTIRNGEATLLKEFARASKATKIFSKVSYFLVESDSTDRTLEILKSIKAQYSNFDYISLGSLSEIIPEQYNRIRYCRNVYVEYIRNLDKSIKPEFVLVLDLDGMNSALSAKSIQSCFQRNDWDVVLSNQTFGYYDILALRQHKWQENDWRDNHDNYKANLNRVEFSRFKTINKFRKLIQLELVDYMAIYSKMVRISKSSPWISVESGFGGAAIYKTEVFLNYDYTKEFETRETDHVTLHRKLVRSGGKIFINPKFINSHFNTYNLNRYHIIRILRKFFWSRPYLLNSRLYKLIKSLKKY
jgi:hypothetical protein